MVAVFTIVDVDFVLTLVRELVADLEDLTDSGDAGFVVFRPELQPKGTEYASWYSPVPLDDF